MTQAADRLFCEKVNRNLTVRRLTVAADHVIPESDIPKDDEPEEEKPGQISLFDEPRIPRHREPTEEDRMLEKERNVQNAIVGIKQKFGKNSVIKAMDLEDGATAIARNAQIGGHKA